MQKCKHSSTRGVCTALSSSHKLSWMFHYSGQQGKEACTFFHEINFGNIFLPHSVFIIAFSKNICDSVKLTSVIFDSE